MLAFACLWILSAFWVYYDATKHQIGHVRDTGAVPNYSGVARGRFSNHSALNWAFGALLLWISSSLGTSSNAQLWSSERANRRSLPAIVPRVSCCSLSARWSS